MIQVLPRVLLNSSRQRWYSLGRTKVRGKKSHLDASVWPKSFSRFLRCLLRFFTMRFLRQSWNINQKDRKWASLAHIWIITVPNYSLTSNWFRKWLILTCSSMYKWLELSLIQARSHQMKSQSSFLGDRQDRLPSRPDNSNHVKIKSSAPLTL